MPYNAMYLWVEGADDVRFAERILKPLFAPKFDAVIVVPYSNEKTTKVDSYLRSVESMGAQYLFFSDIDNAPCVTALKTSLCARYKRLHVSRVSAVVAEIESWYLAGLSADRYITLGLPVVGRTDTITKEAFAELIPANYPSRIDFMIEVLNAFSVDIALGRNTSFAYLVEKHIALH
jgi:hypothetical protein